MREWYQRKTAEERRALVLRRDPEKVRAADRARYQRDKPKRIELARQWQAQNPQKRRESVLAWVARNRDKRDVEGKASALQAADYSRGDAPAHHRADHRHHTVHV